MQVPLDWNAPGGRPISVFVRRFSPRGVPARGRLWALDGGPGEAGDGFVTGWFLETVLSAGFELIVPTHRGVGYGTALRCEGAVDLPSCLEALRGEWGDGIRHFDTHQAARDIVELAGAFPPEQGPDLLFGGSYGTAWVQRVLALEPALFQGGYVDSAAPLGLNFEELGRWSNDVGLALLQQCAEEPACGEQFPAGVLTTAQRVQESVAAGGGCLAQLDTDLTTLQARLSMLLEAIGERALIAPILRRLERCDASDVAELSHWLSREPPAPSLPRSYNGLLNIITIHRETYRVTKPTSDLAALASTHLFDSGGMMAMRERHELVVDKLGVDFPRPAPELEEHVYAGPLHIVQGGLDPRTPPSFATEIVNQWPVATVDVLVVPQGGHASVRFTATESGDAASCTEQWLAAFLRQPEAPFDAGCLLGVPPLDLAGDQTVTGAAATEAFGIDSVWGE